MSGASISAVDKARGLVALDAIQKAGFPDVRVALQVAYAESSWNPKLTNKNKNGSTDYGLFQINTIHKAPPEVYFDPVKNAVFAKRLYDGKENGAKGWKSWVAYTTGRYAKGEPVSVTNAFLATPEAQAKLRDPAKPIDPVGLIEASKGVAGSAMGLAAQSIADPFEVVRAGVKSFLNVLREMFATLIMILVGLALIALGIYMANQKAIDAAMAKGSGALLNLVTGGKAKTATSLIKAVTK